MRKKDLPLQKILYQLCTEALAPMAQRVARPQQQHTLPTTQITHLNISATAPTALVAVVVSQPDIIATTMSRASRIFYSKPVPAGQITRVLRAN